MFSWECGERDHIFYVGMGSSKRKEKKCLSSLDGNPTCSKPWLTTGNQAEEGLVLLNVAKMSEFT